MPSVHRPASWPHGFRVDAFDVSAALVFVLAGQTAPTALLPGGLRTAAEWLPFRHMLGFPIGNVGTINGRSEASAGVVLGVFFIVTGLHNIVFGPSISALPDTTAPS